ncbi:hypothetical protein [Riemerella anatipestifer]|uniref:hypothetical protein n=1 Tax=Riemerella anatipestifer TaxID=34085 RepID=UPI003DA933E8
MDYLKKIDRIVEILSANNRNVEAGRIQDLRQAAFTVTELLLSVGYELSRMVKTPVIKNIIGNEVEDLIQYCKRIGLLIDEA